MMKRYLLLALSVLSASAIADPAKTLYENNFEKADLDKVPAEFLVLDGGFAVKEEAGNKFLELPGAPLDTYGVLFGPTEAADVSASARILGTGKGRRFPSFGVGLNGGAGLKLQVSPAKKLIELYKGEELLSSAPYTWVSGEWTLVRLELRKVKEGEFKIVGKVWNAKAKEPAEPAIQYTFTGDLPPGRASIWGNPYSGTPIRYDDLTLSSLGS